MGLVLSRKEQEAFQITKDIKITVTEVRGKKVRFVVDAPKEMGIWRVDANGRSESAAPPAGEP